MGILRGRLVSRKFWAWLTSMKFWVWLAFSIVAALIPIGLYPLVSIIITGEFPSFYSWFAHGELVLIAIAIISEAVGDLYSEAGGLRGLTQDLWESIVFVFCFLDIIVMSAVFATIMVQVIEQHGEPKHIDVIANISFWIYGIALALGVFCKALVIENIMEEEEDVK